MRKLFVLLFAMACIGAHAQTVCGTVAENSTLTLTAPAGNIFNAIVFASYGTPAGSCGSFAVSGCNASTSVSAVSAVLIGHNSGSIAATNAVFTDPCSGTPKTLSVQAGYTLALPLRLISFSAPKNTDGKITLQWLTNDEINTSQFVIEKSTDGLSFDAIGTVLAKGKSSNEYEFTASLSTAAGSFYRLKMADKDGRFTYSNILRLNRIASTVMSVFPNPATDIITINGLSGKGQIRFLDARGKLLQQINTAAQIITLNISKYAHGIYIMQYRTDKETVSQKLMKQ
jgi:Secretion system C-terminal sorting domain/Galactose binding lectin domain